MWILCYFLCKKKKSIYIYIFVKYVDGNSVKDLIMINVVIF